MTDLAILVPSRGRPESVARLVESCAKTCRTSYVLHFGFDADDEQREANIAAAGESLCDIAPRKGLVPWTNDLADFHLSMGNVSYLASIGDDMVPLTDGWDQMLITAIEHKFNGHGYAYPDDRRRNDIPEAVVVSTSVVAALGHMVPPVVDHWFCDCMWRDIGMGAACMCYVPDVVVEHRHPNVTGQPGDQTYTDAARTYDADLVAYQKWRLYQMPADIRTVKRCSPRVS